MRAEGWLVNHKKTTGCTRKAILIEVVEALVEDHYADDQPFPELVAQIRDVLREELAASRTDGGYERDAYGGP